jgi:putative flippase GtrA
MTLSQAWAREASLAVKYWGASLVGFIADLCVLNLMIRLGLEPAWARVVSLLCAMHVTFLINGLRVFRQLERRLLLRQWTSYMACSGFGNFCNYWIFVTLVSTHWPVISNTVFAVTAGSSSALVLNFLTARFVVFRRRRAVPCEAAAEAEAQPAASASRAAGSTPRAWPSRRR